MRQAKIYLLVTIDPHVTKHENSGRKKWPPILMLHNTWTSHTGLRVQLTKEQMRSSSSAHKSNLRVKGLRITNQWNAPAAYITVQITCTASAIRKKPTFRDWWSQSSSSENIWIISKSYDMQYWCYCDYGSNFASVETYFSRTLCAFQVMSVPNIKTC